MTAEDPVRSGAGFIDRTGRGILRVTGDDRVSFLQGMVTNDVSKLSAGQGCYALHLSVKGRIIADCTVYMGEAWILCETDAGLGAKLAAALEERIVMEEVTVTDETAAYGVVGIYGPRTFDVLGVAPLAPFEHRSLESGSEAVAGIVTGNRWTGEAGAHIIAPRSTIGRQLERLGAGAKPISEVDLARSYIEAGTPRYGVDFGEDTFPLEANLMHAVSLTKGCYVGQEPIARATARGHMNWRLVGLEVDGDAAVAANTIFATEDRPEALRVTSSVRSLILDKTIALAYAHRKVADGVVVRAPDGTTGRIAPLPFISKAES